MAGTHLDVLAETAGGNQHTLSSADVDDSATVRAIETMIDAGLNTDDPALIVDDQVIHDGSQLNLDAEFFAFCKHRIDESGAAVFHHGMTARNGVTAVVSDGFELDADFVTKPFIVGNGFVGDSSGKFFMGKTAAGFQNVGVKKIGIVFNTGLFLHIRSGCCDGAAVDDGVAAGRGHLVNNKNVFHAEIVAFKGSAQAGETGTDNEKTAGLVPFFRNFG